MLLKYLLNHTESVQSLNHIIINIHAFPSVEEEMKCMCMLRFIFVEL